MVAAGDLERIELERAEPAHDAHDRGRLRRQRARRGEEVARDEEAPRGGGGDMTVRVAHDADGTRHRRTDGSSGRTRQSDVSSRPNGLVRPKHQPQAKEPAIPQHDRSAVVDEVIAGYESLMQRLADSHAPEFLEITVTMPQAKLLYLLGAVGELHMSDLVQRLGVSLSTISGLVDRVVDQGLAARREDPADRRQVVVALTPAGRTSSTASASSTPARCASCSSCSATTTSPACADALAALATAAARLASPTGSASPRPIATARKDPA